jgi:DNA-binding NarL/FixJ family response regulator
VTTPEEPTDIRVVIVDDHPIVREGLTALLSSVPGFAVVGVASTGRDAIREITLTRPDVAILDLQMPDLDGFAATRHITRATPEVKVLVLSMHEDDDSVFAAMRAGANGYLVKGAEQDHIIRAIRCVAAGEAVFGPGVAQRILGYFRTTPPADPFPELTNRERQILDLLATGLSNAAIARRLGVATKTIANNVSTIFVKLRVADRQHAIIRARDAGLGHT